MKTVAQFTGAIGIVILGIALVGFAIYGQYQASQLYPKVHQEVGYQMCISQYQAEVAKQQQAQTIPVTPAQ